MVKKKKKRRKLTPFTRLLCLLLIGISVYFLYAVGKEIVTTVTLQRQLAQVQEKLQEVKDENKYLTDQKEKLQDPDYVENYARGNYQLSKDGDQIFYLPEDSSK
ncbi:MAG: septum formation initiator family protein [Erysipelotrichaceae bacterium]|jgi:cell division protein DivIC|nr:septum formation initiator family protein [Erysipelotrichaceae bacterium]